MEKKHPNTHDVALGGFPIIQDLADGGGVVGRLERQAHPVSIVLRIPPPDLTAAVKARYFDSR
jgi:hypothetical protein